MRTDSYSALDFMYWILEAIEENYTGHTTEVFMPDDSSTGMQSLIVDASLVCGVSTPRTFSALKAKVERYSSAIGIEEAMRMRGAVLHKNGVLHVCVGDKNRAVGIDTSGYISLYNLSINEKQLGYWDGAFTIPELRYL